MEKLEEHLRTFSIIWNCFLKVAKVCLEHGGKIVIEWPTGCDYWRWPNIHEFMEERK